MTMLPLYIKVLLTKESAPKGRPIFDSSLLNKLEFLSETGVIPAYLYPDYGLRVGFGPKTGLGFGFLSRNKIYPSVGVPEVYFPGIRGSLILEIRDLYTPEEMKRALELLKKLPNTKYYYGEDPKFSVSRQTFKIGGKLIPKYYE